MKAYFVPYLVVKDLGGGIRFGAMNSHGYTADEAEARVYLEVKKIFPTAQRIELSDAIEVTREFITVWAEEYGII